MRWNLGGETTVSASFGSPTVVNQIILIDQTLTSIGNVHIQWKNNAVCCRSKNQQASLQLSLLSILFSIPFMDF